MSTGIRQVTLLRIAALCFTTVMATLEETLRHICSELLSGRPEQARETAVRDIPFSPAPRVKREYSPRDVVATAIRDGFVDRYSGSRLVFPGTLRLLSVLFPNELPFHTNWAYDKCHPMYWELYPTLDHVVPVARGGADAPDNWVSTSQRMNSAKAHWMLDELGWALKPAGTCDAWDGLISWFVEFTDCHPALAREHGAIADWRSVARSEWTRRSRR